MINPINIFSTSFQTNPLKAQTIPQPRFIIPLKQDTISFTGAKEDLVRTIGNVSCPCCGVKMLTDKQFKKISSDLSKGNTAEHYINTLKPYEEYMHEAEKELFNRFEDWGKSNPKKNLGNFLQENKDQSLKACKDKQQQVFDQIKTVSKAICPELGQNFEKLTVTYSKTPLDTEEDLKDVRKWMISDVENAEVKIEKKEAYKILKELADSLPISKNDSDAFIVRYAKEPSLKIGQRLLKLSAGTIEHIKPQANGGGNRIDNYLLECGECNHTRGNIPLDKWVKDHPEMIENTQKYFDEVIEKINNEELPGLENYPNNVKGAINAQSKGTLTYDVSKLKPKKGSVLNLVA